MTRLPIVDFKTMERVLLSLVLRLSDRKEAMYSTDTQMGEQLPYPVTQVEI
jgi:hypothetical protein